MDHSPLKGEAKAAEVTPEETIKKQLGLVGGVALLTKLNVRYPKKLAKIFS